MTMYHIETIEVSSGGAASITFSSIPQIYTDLYLLISGRSTRGENVDGCLVKFNGSSSNYSLIKLEGTGSSTSSNSGSTAELGYLPGSTITSNTFSSNSYLFPNYTISANKSRSVDSVVENNATASSQILFASLWSDTSAITSLEISAANGNLVEFTTASLYGISKFSALPKAEGGVISFDAVNNKWVHTFTASGTFTPTEDLSAEYLVIAGGGGGGNTHSGGGGAGGYRCSVSGESSGGGASAESALSLTASTGYTVTVGGGGASATNGTDSVFATITSTGGGTRNTSGGSGGGGTPGASGAAGTANQGYAGGAGTTISSQFLGGGGGGASEVGKAGNDGTGRNQKGGDGVSSSITGSAVTRAGGGSGGSDLSYFSAITGGAGGGGDGGSGEIAPTAGATNTGSGGGGGGARAGGGPEETGASGGSGIVIVRYSA